MYCLKGMDSFDQVVDIARANLAFYGQKVEVGEWQAKQAEWEMLEIDDLSFEWDIPPGIKTLQAMVQPSLPWAEDHFLERISGVPWNPPPSHEYWPYSQNANAEHRPDGEKFSHTYPERFWPKTAGKGRKLERRSELLGPHQGIRFQYGDLSDLIELLVSRPNTRQAYLPVWFPEDLMASRLGERVPCSLGYHFSIRRNRLDCRYYIRSCDFFRHFRDDVYMAARLAQYIAQEVDFQRQANSHEMNPPNENTYQPLTTGKLIMHIANLHVFSSEKSMLEHQIEERKKERLMEGGW